MNANERELENSFASIRVDSRLKNPRGIRAIGRYQLKEPRMNANERELEDSFASHSC